MRVRLNGHGNPSESTLTLKLYITSQKKQEIWLLSYVLIWHFFGLLGSLYNYLDNHFQQYTIYLYVTFLPIFRITKEYLFPYTVFMKKLALIALLFATFILAWCTQNPQEISYDQDSRKTMIPENCKSFFDGCNNCSRINDWENIACTKMFCETYKEPKCLDTMHPSWDLDNDWINDCESNGTCDDSVDYTKPKQETTTYNSESRKTIIPENCKSFFDGCNNCSKGENEEQTACTMMYCEIYQQPKCLD